MQQASVAGRPPGGLWQYGHVMHVGGVLQDSVVMVKELFRNKEATEFVVATIPTMLAVKESERLLRSLRKDNIPCKRIVVNQVRSPVPRPCSVSRASEGTGFRFSALGPHFLHVQCGEAGVFLHGRPLPSLHVYCGLDARGTTCAVHRELRTLGSA